MKRLLLIIACIILLSSTASASPFLICDSQSGVDSYTISESGIADVIVSPETDGSIKYDLSSIADGTHSWSVKACNLWGCSATVPFGFTKSLPVPAGNLKIKK